METLSYDIHIRLNPDRASHRETAAFCGQHTEKIADVLSVGYVVYSSGLYDYFRAQEGVNSRQEREWEECMNALKRKYAQLETSIDEEVQRKLELETGRKVRCLQQSAEMDQKMLKQELDYALKESQTLQQRLQQKTSELHNIREMVESEWKQRLEQSVLLERQKTDWLEKEVSTLKETKEADVQLWREKWEETMALLESKDRDMSKYLETMTSEEFKTLKEQLQKKDAEIQILKSGNIIKGREGEMMIKESLQEHFTDWVFEYKGKTPHECDLHMTSVQDDLVMIESKNKDAITKLDIDKFYNDIGYLAQQQRPCLGAVFISIKTRNIPHKGSHRLEMVNKTPVLFMGFLNEEELRMYLPQHVKAFVQLCYLMRQQMTDVNVDVLFQNMNQHFVSLVQEKTVIDKLKDQVQDMTKTIGDLEKMHQKTCQTLEQSLRQHNQFQPGALSGGGGGAKKNVYQCTKCSECFTNKRACDTHMRGCGT
jgi:hypothetical protein